MFCPACGRPHSGECDKMALLRNELDYQKQVRNGGTATAALEWSIAEIERLRASLQQVKDVCEDNSSAQCNAHMALNFVWGVADNALNTKEAADLAE